VLSQNTTDANSGRAYEMLRERFATWDGVAAADARTIASAIKVGGLGRIKAKRIKKVLRTVSRERGRLDLGFLRGMSTDEVLGYLQRFEGVGLKTAACVALFGLGRDVIPVDTHVHRVVGRLGVVGHPRDRAVTFDAMRAAAPPELALSIHVNLIHLGREYCRPANPRCRDCPLATVCEHAGTRLSAGSATKATGGRRPRR
jgi:endonuclease-3